MLGEGGEEGFIQDCSLGRLHTGLFAGRKVSYRIFFAGMEVSYRFFPGGKVSHRIIC